MAAAEQQPAPPARPTPAAAKPAKKRRALRILGVVLATPLVLGGLGVGYLHSGAGKARVKAVLEQRLRERVDGTVDVGVVDYALFGEVKLGDVHVKDNAGVEAVALTSLTVTPSWSDLFGGRIILERVALSGVAVHLVKDADGGSNLKRLIKPQPESPEKKPLDKLIQVKALSIADVGVDITQPDGSRIVVSNVGVEGSLAVHPARRSVDVEIAKLGLSVLVDKGQGGLKLGVTGVETGLTVKLDEGTGKVTLHPLKGHVAVTLPQKEGDPAPPAPRGFDIGLAALSADIGENSTSVSLDQLLAGAVALASVEVKGRVADGKIEGQQDADVLGLKLSGARVNELLGKEVLLGDIDIDTHVHGPPGEIAVQSKIKTAGAALTVDGSVGITDPTRPTYDVKLTVDAVDTEKLLASGLGVPRVVVDKVEVSVKGQGQQVDTAGATAKVKVSGATARGVRVDGVEFEGELERGILKVKSVDARAVGQRITATGEVELATKRIDLTLGLDGDVGDALARLNAAGLPVKASLPRGAVRLAPGDLKVQAKGHLGGVIDVTATAAKLAVFGGTVGLDARTSLIRHDPPLEGGKKVTVTAMDADIKIGGVKLSSILAMRGKKLEGMEGVLSGDIHVEGTPESPKARLMLGLATSRTDGGKTARLSLSGDVTPTSADLRASLTPSNGAEELFGLRARLPLSMGGAKKGLDLHRSLDIHASLPKRKLADLWEYVPKHLTSGTIQTLPEGDLSLDLDVKGTAARPEGKLGVVLNANLVPGASSKIEIGAALRPGPSGIVVSPTVDVWFDGTQPKLIHLGGDVDLSRSPLVGKPEVAYRGRLEVSSFELGVPGFLLWKAGIIDFPLVGTLTLAADFQGNKEDLGAKVLATVDGAEQDKPGRAQLSLLATLGDADTDVDLRARVTDLPDMPSKPDLLKLAGKIGLGGKKLFAKIKAREHLASALGLTLEIPQRPLASLAPLAARLEKDDAAERIRKAPGDLSGSIAVTGTLKTPLANGSVVLSNVDRMDGQKGGLGVHLDAGADVLRAYIGVGVLEKDKAPLSIVATAPREPLTKMSEGVTLPIHAEIRGKSVDLRQLVPAVYLADTKVGVKGTLDWNMDVDVELAKVLQPSGKKETEVTKGVVKGLLDMPGATIALPGTKRSYHDVGLHLVADERGLHLDALRAKETDIDVAGRSVSVKADVTLDKLKPTAATVDVAADRWLLFGPRVLGFADAPRGTLTLDAHATADLAKPTRKASVDVKKLTVLIPERFERAHQPEDVQAGDLVFLDDGKVALGKLPLPASVQEKKEKRKKALASPQPPKKVSPFDISIHVAKGARFLQAPMELQPAGDLTVQIRQSGAELRGKLDITAGALSLGGAEHPIAKGSLTFDEKNPKGYLDLYFERRLKPAALRGISEASAGQAARIHMSGPISDRKTLLSGAGSPGALWDLLSMHNVGRERSVTEPDLPKSMAVDFPQHDSLLVLSFLSVNLPHLLFLDRFAIWADPYDDLSAYGRLTHFEAERYVADGSVRVRAGARPRAAGQSEAELEIDYLFVNLPRMLLGVGVTGGTRGGGGPGLVWEWSSKD